MQSKFSNGKIFQFYRSRVIQPSIIASAYYIFDERILNKISAEYMCLYSKKNGLFIGEFELTSGRDPRGATNQALDIIVSRAERGRK